MSFTLIPSRSEEDVRKDIKAIRTMTRRLLTSKEAARAHLIKIGYLTKDGKLPKRIAR